MKGYVRHARLCTLTIAAALAIGALPATPAHAAACAHAAALPTPQQVVAARQAVDCLINAERQGHGLRAVRVSWHLHSAAQRHAQDMLARHYFDHNSPTGSTLYSRVRASGYLHRTRAFMLGEALAWGELQLGQPARLIDALMHSAEHRAIILDPRFRQLGIGLAVGVPVAGDVNPGATLALDFGRVTRAAGHRHRRHAPQRRRHVGTGFGWSWHSA